MGRLLLSQIPETNVRLSPFDTRKPPFRILPWLRHRTCPDERPQGIGQRHQNDRPPIHPTKTQH